MFYMCIMMVDFLLYMALSVYSIVVFGINVLVRFLIVLFNFLMISMGLFGMFFYEFVNVMVKVASVCFYLLLYPFVVIYSMWSYFQTVMGVELDDEMDEDEVDTQLEMLVECDAVYLTLFDVMRHPVLTNEILLNFKEDEMDGAEYGWLDSAGYERFFYDLFGEQQLSTYLELQFLQTNDLSYSIVLDLNKMFYSYKLIMGMWNYVYYKCYKLFMKLKLFSY